MTTLHIVEPARLLTPRRVDVAVKWRFFRHMILKDDAEAEQIYRWHVEQRVGDRIAAGIPADRWKMSVDDYVRSAELLLECMETYGFCATPASAIPVDATGELLGGAHRLACAIALEMNQIAVRQVKEKVFAPAWDLEWFQSRMTAADLGRLGEDWKRLTGHDLEPPAANAPVFGEEVKALAV